MIAIDETREASPEIIQFLNNVRWGTQGVLYTVSQHDKILAALPHPLFMLLRNEDRVLGMRMLLQKKVRISNQQHDAFYHSLFSVKADQKGQGYGKMLAQATLDRMRALLGEKGLIYAYVEAGNERSFQISESLGYQLIGQFHANLFSRLSPKDSTHVFKLPEDSRFDMQRALSELYSDHALTDFEMSLKTQDYWILKKDGILLAGAQVKPQQWKMESIGGIGGKLAVHVIPRLPLLGTLFNPADWRFLKIGNLYARPGQEKALLALIEALMNRFHVKSAMAFLDHRSPVFKRLRAAGPFGLLNSLTESEVRVYAYTHNLDSQTIEDLRRRPLIISPLDI